MLLCASRDSHPEEEIEGVPPPVHTCASEGSELSFGAVPTGPLLNDMKPWCNLFQDGTYPSRLKHGTLILQIYSATINESLCCVNKILQFISLLKVLIEMNYFDIKQCLVIYNLHSITISAAIQNFWE
jgi:hypothetical protein